jgi:hypothetical protein
MFNQSWFSRLYVLSLKPTAVPERNVEREARIWGVARVTVATAASRAVHAVKHGRAARVQAHTIHVGIWLQVFDGFIWQTNIIHVGEREGAEIHVPTLVAIRAFSEFVVRA